MSTQTTAVKIVVKGGQYIMPRAAKPTQSARPKPAPKPAASKKSR